MNDFMFIKKVKDLNFTSNLVKGKTLPCKVIIKYRATTTSWLEDELEFPDGNIDITLDVNKSINTTFWLTFISLIDENIKHKITRKI